MLFRSACWYFRSIWIYDGPESKRLVQNGVARYNDKDFIDYLNNWEMPEYNSVLVEDLGSIENLPEQYKDCPRYSF